MNTISFWICLSLLFLSSNWSSASTNERSNQTCYETLVDDLLKGRTITPFTLRGVAITKINEIIKRSPDLPVPPTLNHLENTQEGAYKIAAPPSLELLRSANSFGFNKGELGFALVREQWFIVISRNSEFEYPEPLESLRAAGKFEIDIHTHPGTDPGSLFPSLSDLDRSRPSGRIYISTFQGLIEVTWPKTASAYNSKKLFEDWMIEKGIPISRYHGKAKWEIFEAFATEVFQMKRIPWSESSTISELLKLKS